MGEQAAIKGAGVTERMLTCKGMEGKQQREANSKAIAADMTQPVT